MKLTPYNRDDFGKSYKNSFVLYTLDWHFKGAHYTARETIASTRLIL